MDGIKLPTPKLPKNRAGMSYQQDRFIVHPDLAASGLNPRREDTYGYHFHQIIADATPKEVTLEDIEKGEIGISYTDLKAKVEADERIQGFSNHLNYELKNHFVLSLRALAKQLPAPAEAEAGSEVAEEAKAEAEAEEKKAHHGAKKK